MKTVYLKSLFGFSLMLISCYLMDNIKLFIAIFLMMESFEISNNIKNTMKK